MNLGALGTIPELPVSIISKGEYSRLASSKCYAVWESLVRHRIQNGACLIRKIW